MNRSDRAALIEIARHAFGDIFGNPPSHGAIAPGRVNLIGEHTDYNDGFVMPLAIDRWTVVLGRVSMRSESTIVAHDLHQSHAVDVRQPLNPVGESFADYVLGVIDQFKAKGIVVPNVELLVTGNIPLGAGLSSSASLEVATALTLQQITGTKYSPREIALLGQAAETDFVGVPCGIMDMFVITLAESHAAMMIDCRSLQYETLPFAIDGDVALLVVGTGVDRSLRDGDYAALRKMCASVASKLGLPALRDAKVDDIKGAAMLNHDERQRALHVLNENHRVLQAARAMRGNDWTTLGDLMFASHQSLRDLYRVSIDELDLIVDAAQSLRNDGRGVFGARMTGAGFGGCAIVLCRSDVVNRVGMAINEAFEGRFNRRSRIMRVHAVGGAEPLALQ